MIDKKILTIFILSLITCVLLTMMLTQYFVEKKIENIDSFYLEEIEELREQNINISEDFNKQIIDILISYQNTNNSDTVVEEINNEEMNRLLLDVANKFIQQNTENQIAWDNNLKTILENLPSRSSRTYYETIYIPVGGAS